MDKLFEKMTEQLLFGKKISILGNDIQRNISIENMMKDLQNFLAKVIGQFIVEYGEKKQEDVEIATSESGQFSFLIVSSKDKSIIANFGVRMHMSKTEAVPSLTMDGEIISEKDKENYPKTLKLISDAAVAAV